MGSIAVTPNGISFLSQPGTGLLNNTPVKLDASALDSASQQDVVALSTAALQLQDAQAIFGTPQTTNSSSGQGLFYSPASVYG